MKDPAILFYTSDFLTGTFTMTDDQVGKYIRLLCLQHQKGYLCEKDMLNICKSYDEDIYNKFVKEGDKYYNERMKNEAEKRKRYSESRSANRTKRDNVDLDINNISKSYVNHMENVNENINKKEIKTENKNLAEVLGWDKDIELGKGIKRSYPKLFLMKAPLRYDEHNKLVNKYTIEKVKNIYMAMQNRPDLTKKYESAYLTANNWLNREVKR